MQTVYGLAALALAVPVAFHWRQPPQEEEGPPPGWDAVGLTWQAKVQLVAFCLFEVRPPGPEHCNIQSQWQFV